ncbi:MAG: hypothetical protein Q8P46_15485 [Hyphomicrobiales bacterium]|nr:hypothetical protein [Hyphomicrobiales bacterium]
MIELTMETIIAAKDFALKAEIQPIERNGHEFYMVVMPDGSTQKVSAMRARADWRDYYRSVRILRRIRQANVATFQRFSRVWYDCSYKAEIENIEWPRPPKRTRSLP